MQNQEDRWIQRANSFERALDRLRSNAYFAEFEKLLVRLQQLKVEGTA